MKHGRRDYDRIQDPAGLIPVDEPVFLLRGQDVAAPRAIRAWMTYARHGGASDNILDAAERQIHEMERWQREHHCKVPDMPPGKNTVKATTGKSLRRVVKEALSK
jgi:hypothetical protein